MTAEVIQSCAPRPLVKIQRDHVLLVDDDPDLVVLFRLALRHVDPDLVLDWETTEQGAVEAMKFRSYSAVISDYELEQGNGVGVCRAALDLVATDRLAVISGHPIGPELRELGGSQLRFLPKPFSQPKLIHFLRSCLIH